MQPCYWTHISNYHTPIAQYCAFNTVYIQVALANEAAEHVLKYKNPTVHILQCSKTVISRSI